MSSSQRKDIGRFAFKLSLFVLPIALPVLLALGIAAYLGELLPLSALIRVQQEDERVIYHPSGSRDNFLDYKLYSTLYLRPDILFLGSSRLQFTRMSIFNKEEFSAYNASVLGLRVDEMLDFLNHLAEADALPELLVINLDYPDFNANRIVFRGERNNFSNLDVFSEYRRIFSGAQLGLRTFFSNPLDFFALTNRRNWEGGQVALGLETIERNMGYRQDGSFFRNYGDGRNGIDANLRWIETGRENYEYGQEVDMDSIASLDALLTLAEEKGIVLVAVLPPYHPEIYAAMDFTDKYRYIPEAQTAIHALFAERNFLLFDFTDPASLPMISGDAFFDGWHLAETGSLQMWMSMLSASPDILGAYSDSEGLETMLAESSRFYLPR